MSFPGFGASILILIGLWALAGVIRDYRGTADAAASAYHATYILFLPGKTDQAQPAGRVRGRDLLAEFAAGGAAVAAAAGAALGWALGMDAYHAVKALRERHRDDQADGSDRTASDSRRDPAATADGLGMPHRLAALLAFFGFLSFLSRERGRDSAGRIRGRRGAYIDGEFVDVPDSTAIPLAAADPNARPGDTGNHVTYVVTQVVDPIQAPAPAAASPIVKEIGSMSDIVTSMNGPVAPSATLSQTKAGLARTAEAAAALQAAVRRQTGVSDARSQSARARALEAQSLAEQAVEAARAIRATAQIAQANRVDGASLAALFGLAQLFDVLASHAISAAESAQRVAAAEQVLAEAFNNVANAAANCAVGADNARQVVSRHQDPHQQAVGQTGHEGATTQYLAG